MPDNEEGDRVTMAEAAAEQLHFALVLFLDAQAYMAAITLAGAADECLGKQLGADSVHKKLSRYVVAELGESSEVLNSARNWLKHGTGDAPLRAALIMEAVTMICRACGNYAQVFRSKLPIVDRFNEWLERHPDLKP